MQTSAILCRSSLDSSGYLNSQALAFSNVLLPPPSTMYAIKVQGAPQKPISGTSPSSLSRVILIASYT